jgi:hypothetical protein
MTWHVADGHIKKVDGGMRMDEINGEKASLAKIKVRADSALESLSHNR